MYISWCIIPIYIFALVECSDILRVRNVYLHHIFPLNSTRWHQEGRFFSHHIHSAIMAYTWPPSLQSPVFSVHFTTRWIFLMSYFLYTMTLVTSFQWLSTDHNIDQNSLRAWYSNPNLIPIYNLPTSFPTWKHYFGQIIYFLSHTYTLHFPASVSIHGMEYTSFSIHPNLTHSSRAKSKPSLPQYFP